MSLLDYDPKVNLSGRRRVYRKITENYAINKDYASNIQKLPPKPRQSPSIREGIIVDMVLEGVPIISLVLFAVGLVFVIKTILSDNLSYLFPSIYFMIGFGALFALSRNVKRRYYEARSSILMRIVDKRAEQ